MGRQFSNTKLTINVNVMADTIETRRFSERFCVLSSLIFFFLRVTLPSHLSLALVLDIP